MSRRRRRAPGAGQSEGGREAAPGAGRGEAAPGAGGREARPRPARRGAAPSAGRPQAASGAPTAPGRGPYRIRPVAQVAILVAVFAVVTLIAELAGAANLGVALGVGQIAFGIALVVVLVRS